MIEKNKPQKIGYFQVKNVLRRDSLWQLWTRANPATAHTRSSIYADQVSNLLQHPDIITHYTGNPRRSTPRKTTAENRYCNVVMMNDEGKFYTRDLRKPSSQSVTWGPEPGAIVATNRRSTSTCSSTTTTHAAHVHLSAPQIEVGIDNYPQEVESLNFLNITRL